MADSVHIAHDTSATSSHNTDRNTGPHLVAEQTQSNEQSMICKPPAPKPYLLNLQFHDCFVAVVPIVLGGKGTVATELHGTPGMLALYATCIDLLVIADKIFHTTILVCNLTRRLNIRRANQKPISEDERLPLTTYIEGLYTIADEARLSLREVTLKQKTLLSSTTAFMPSAEQVATMFTLPEGLESEREIRRQIIMLIKAQMVHKVGAHQIPDIFKDLDNIITNIPTTLADQASISEQLDDITSAIRVLCEHVRSGKSPETDDQTSMMLLHDKCSVFVEQIPFVNDIIPTSCPGYLEQTRKVIAEMRKAWLSLNSVGRVPRNRWQLDGAEYASRVILSQTSRGSSGTMLFVVMFTAIKKLRHAVYSLSLNVKCRLDDNSPVPRLDKLGIRLCLKAAHSISSNFAFPPMISFYSPSKEISNISTICATQLEDNTLHWTVIRNDESSADISERDLSVTIYSPVRPDIRLEVTITAEIGEERRRRKFLRWRKRGPALVICSQASDVINVEEGLLLGIFHTPEE